MNKFSIIIPVYNAERYLQDCLDSVLNQDYENWTAICVNDGSTDDSLNILRAYEKRDSRIQVFSQENMGVSAARNFALKLVQYEPNNWIAFVDADDFIAPDMLSSINKILTQNPDKDIKYLKTTCKLLSHRGEKAFVGGGKKLIYNTLDNKGYFSKGNVGGFIASVIVRSDMVKQTGIIFPTDMKVLEDQVFSIRLALESPKIIEVFTPFYYYYLDENSQGVKNFNRDDVIRCINYICDSIKNIHDKKILSYFHNRYFPLKVGMVYQCGKSISKIAFHEDFRNIHTYLLKYYYLRICRLPKRILHKMGSFLK